MFQVGADDVILVALGANLPSQAGSPIETLEAAIGEMERCGLQIEAKSLWYETPPDPPSDQPNYVNGVVRVLTSLKPSALLELLLEIETAFGRTREALKNAPRSLDLDLIAYNDLVQDGPPILPHPRMANRPFVLIPLRDVAPDWIDPVSKVPLAELIDRLGPAAHSAKPLNS